MRYINIKTFHKNFFKEVKDLPITITRLGVPVLVLSEISGEKNFEKIIVSKKEVEIKDVTNGPFEKREFVEPVMKVAQSKDFHVCEWDKTFKCTSPGIVQKGNKWFCVPHSIQ